MKRDSREISPMYPVLLLSISIRLFIGKEQGPSNERTEFSFSETGYPYLLKQHRRFAIQVRSDSLQRFIVLQQYPADVKFFHHP